MARPSEYTQETAERICVLLAEGKSLRAVCKVEGMPDRETVRRWLDTHESFAAKYAHARDLGLDERAEKLREDIAEETDLQRARLIFDYEKWFLSKLAPKKYGEKVTQELTGEGGGPVQIARVERVIVRPNPSDPNS